MGLIVRAVVAIKKSMKRVINYYYYVIYEK